MGTNMLTGHTDKHWKAVRKGVAPAFSAQHMRCALTDTPFLWTCRHLRFFRTNQEGSACI